MRAGLGRPQTNGLTSIEAQCADGYTQGFDSSRLVGELPWFTPGHQFFGGLYRADYSNQATLTGGIVRFYPFAVGADVTLDHFAIQTSASQYSKAALGVYRSKADGSRPTTLVAQSPEFELLATQLYVRNAPSDVSLAPGAYFLAVLTESAVNVAASPVGGAAFLSAALSYTGGLPVDVSDLSVSAEASDYVPHVVISAH